MHFARNPAVAAAQQADSLASCAWYILLAFAEFNLRLSPLLGFGPKLKRVNTNNSTRSVGEFQLCTQLH